MKRILFVLFMSCAAICCTEVVAQTPQPGTKSKEKSVPDNSSTNAPVSDFDMPDSNGKMVSISFFKGKYIILDFWASWCTSSRERSRSLKRIYRQYQNNDMVVIGISLDSNRGRWLDAIKEDELDWLQLSDLKEWNNEAVVLYNIRSVPSYIIINKSGKVITQTTSLTTLMRKIDAIRTFSSNSPY